MLDFTKRSKIINFTHKKRYSSSFLYYIILRAIDHPAMPGITSSTPMFFIEQWQIAVKFLQTYIKFPVMQVFPCDFFQHLLKLCYNQCPMVAVAYV